MSKRKTEKLGIEKLPLEELKAERVFVDFDSAMKGIINVGGNRISTFNEFVEFCHRNFPEQSNNTIITTWEKLPRLRIWDILLYHFHQQILLVTRICRI